jgi:hypothetical protein
MRKSYVLLVSSAIAALLLVPEVSASSGNPIASGGGKGASNPSFDKNKKGLLNPSFQTNSKRDQQKVNIATAGAWAAHAAQKRQDELKKAQEAAEAKKKGWFG